MSNILEVTFESGQTFATAQRLWKGDYGQILLIHGPELPSYYEVHFASTKDGTPEVSVGTPSGVQIPNRLLQAEGYIYAWVFLHVGANDGATKFQVKIPVEERGIPIDQETPEDQTAVQQAIAALNAETGRAEAAADAAEVSEQNAKASEDAAALSEQNAEDAAQAAATSAENAAISETGAAESEAAAAASAQQAATSAEAAAQYAASAGGSEELVEEYARRAKGSADTAELYGTMAVNAKDAAEASARSATQASQAAVSAKNIAETAAQTATQKATEASSSAGVASSQASMAAAEAAAASGYADNAEGSARQAAASAEDAADSAEDADASAASARLNNEQAQAAKVDAQTAAGNASAAQTAAEAAQTAAETAQGKAKDSQTAAETAQGLAEAAQGLAEAAQTAAEAAQYIAEDAADQAQEWADRVPSMLPVDTVDGPIASFPDGADDVPLKSLIVDINPVQDLHGYNSPWPAGGGKNKLPNPIAGTITESGVTLTAHSDGTFSISGTSTASETKLILFDLADSYVIPVSVGNGGQGCFYINNSFSGTGIAFQLYNGSTKVDEWALTSKNRTSSTYAGMAGKTVNKVGISFPSGATVNGTFAPMFTEDGSTTATYSPYSNECPISGWDSVTVEQTGKNLFYMSDVFDQVRTSVTGELNAFVVTATGTYSRVVYRIHVKQGKKYTVSFDGDSTGNYNLVYISHDDNINHSYYTIQLSSTSASYTRTITAAESDLLIVFYVSTNTSTGEMHINNFMIEEGESKTDYVMPQPSSILISLGSTVYSGTLDVLTGVVTVDWVSRRITSMNRNNGHFFYIGSGQWEHRPLAKLTTTGGLLCDRRPTIAQPSSGSTAIDGCYTDSSRAFNIRTLESYATASEMMTAMGGEVNICYKTDPFTIQLTPQEVNSLLGTNNIWADTGDTHVIYRADIGLYIQKLTGSTEEDMTANQNIDSGKYFLVGNTLYLSTSAIAAGEQIVPGTNCTLTNLAAALNALNS